MNKSFLSQTPRYFSSSQSGTKVICNVSSINGRKSTYFASFWDFGSNYTDCQGSAGGRAQPFLWKNLCINVRRVGRVQVRPRNVQMAEECNALIKALVSRRNEKRLNPCVTLLTKSIFPSSSERAMLPASMVPGLSLSLSLCELQCKLNKEFVWRRRKKKKRVQQRYTVPVLIHHV